MVGPKEMPMPTDTGRTDFYNDSYGRQNYFGYREWIYEPYISSLVAFCGLTKGSSVLDVGCGQGFFSYLFGKQGMKVHGIDPSETGIRMARELYGSSGVTFAVADIEQGAVPEQYDCIFVRSCSLYNTDDFPFRSDTTDSILRHLKPGGTYIFAYNSNFSSKASPRWRYHSIEDTKKHFSAYSDVRFFFVTRAAACVLNKYSLSPAVTRLNVLLSRIFGMGGDLVCILRKS
jgi:SAM-dependent methyltransferase